MPALIPTPTLSYITPFGRSVFDLRAFPGQFRFLPISFVSLPVSD